MHKGDAARGWGDVARCLVLAALLPFTAAANSPVVTLDPPPGLTQKPYTPAEGQSVSVNPPPFLWVPAGSKSSYVLEVSTAKDFPAGATRTWTKLSRSAFVPQETLPPGSYFWRYGVETKSGPVLGRARPFTIPADARPFPFPRWDAVLARVPQQRPRLFFPGQRLEQVRAWAKGELKPAVDALVAACRKEIDKPLVPEPGYGPKGPEMGPWRVNIMRTTRPPMDVMERCALAYLLTGDRALGAEAKRRLLYFFSWDPNGPTSFFAYDEPPMWVMMRGTRAYDWTYDLFAPEERAKVEANMRVRAAQFYTRLQRLPFESDPYESHAGRLPGFLGECALSFLHQWPEAREWLEYVTLLYYTSYPAWGGDDGGWQEGPSYWGAYMSFAMHYVVALREAAGVDLMQKPFFRHTPYFGLYVATPYHQFLPFGDNQQAAPHGLGPLMYSFATLTQDPYLRWYAENSKATLGADPLSLATYDPQLKARNPGTLPGARSFPAVGLASFHTALGDAKNDVDLLFRCSPYGAVSHGHADQNAFALEAYGRGLAIASGYYPWYGSPHHQEWTRATRAVNSVLVDGQGQVRREWGCGGQLTAFASVDGYDYAEGEAAGAYRKLLTTFRRHVVHVRPGLFVVFDNLVAPRPARFDWLLHAVNKIEVDASGHRLQIHNAPAAMEVRLLLPARVEIAQTDRYQPDPEPQANAWVNTWHLTARTPEPALAARYLAVLMPYREGHADSLPHVELVPGDGAVGVRLTAKNGAQDLIAFRTDPQASTVRCDSAEGTWRVFAAGTDAHGVLVRRWALPQ